MKNSLREHLDEFMLYELDWYEREEREKIENQLEKLIENGDIDWLFAYIEVTGKEIDDALNSYEENSTWIGWNHHMLEEFGNLLYNNVYDTDFGYVIVEGEE